MERLGKRQPTGGKGVKIKLSVRSQQWTYRVGRLLLGAVFIYAAIFKMGSPQDFADSIAAYQILPFSVINVLALGLPFFELACGLLVIVGLFLRPAILGILVMLFIFIGTLIIALFRELSIDCGCFGAHSWLDSKPWFDLFRDGVLLAITVFVYKYSISNSQYGNRGGET
jgi:putative oxidoreductase